MGAMESAAGDMIGAKKVTETTQKDIIENLGEYYHGSVNLKKAKRMMALGALTVLSPYIILVGLLLALPHITAHQSISGSMAGIIVIGLFAWMGLSAVICQNISKKYTHYAFLQDPKKEKIYRWQYLILFEGEVSEWKKYIKKNALMRPSGLVDPVVINRHTYQVVRTLDGRQYKA